MQFAFTSNGICVLLVSWRCRSKTTPSSSPSSSSPRSAPPPSLVRSHQFLYPDVISDELSFTGGVGMGPQEAAFRQRYDLLVCTPGRLLDHLQNFTQYAHLRDIEFLIVDEADRYIELLFRLSLHWIFLLDALACSTWVSCPTCARSSPTCPTLARSLARPSSSLRRCQLPSFSWYI